MRAEVRAAAADDDLLNRPAAVRARLTLPPVDEKLILERAPRAVDMPEVVDRSALGLDPSRERRFDRIAQPLPLWPGEPPGLPQRVDPGAKQGFVGVDVADARDPALVEQE